MKETLHVAGLDFEVRRSQRRKTFALMVGRSGELVAYVPPEISAEELSRWISRKLVWVHRKLAQKRQNLPGTPTPEYVSGEAFPFLGRRFRLRVVEEQEPPLQFDGAQFSLRRSEPSPESCFRRWYMQTGSAWIEERVKALSSRTGKMPVKVEVRDLGFRWGSCGKADILFFHWKLLQLPSRLVDYVIVHELVHLHERNHGPAFFKAMDRSLPDWRQRKEALEAEAKNYLAFHMRPI